MKYNTSSRIASIVFAICIAVFGIRNIMKAGSMETIVPDYIPGGIIWVYISGIGMILAGLAIVLDNKLTRLACYLLAGVLMLFVLMLHLKPAIDGNPGNLLKDTAIAMGAIIIGNLSYHHYRSRINGDRVT
jgi:putative oxidoreductase